MRLPTTEERAGLANAKEMLLRHAARWGNEDSDAAAAWIEDVLQTAGEDDLAEVLIDLDAKGREQRWCLHCPGNDGYGSCAWYDLFDTPADGPDILETDGPAAPELCPFRQPGRAVLVRAL